MRDESKNGHRESTRMRDESNNGHRERESKRMRDESKNGHRESSRIRDESKNGYARECVISHITVTGGDQENA